MKLPFNVDLSNKVVVVTGGAGVLGGFWVDALAECNAKVAILFLANEDASSFINGTVIPIDGGFSAYSGV